MYEVVTYIIMETEANQTQTYRKRYIPVQITITKIKPKSEMVIYLTASTVNKEVRHGAKEG